MIALPHRLPLYVALLVGCGAIAHLALVYDTLPGTLLSHFDAQGRPNGTQTRAAFAAALVGTELCLGVTFLALPWLLRVLPIRFINLPNRDYLLAPERRANTIRHVTRFSDWVASASILLVTFAFESALATNTHGHAFPAAAMGMAVAAMLLLVLLGSLWFTRSLRSLGSAPVDAASRKRDRR